MENETSQKKSSQKKEKKQKTCLSRTLGKLDAENEVAVTDCEESLLVLGKKGQ